MNTEALANLFPPGVVVEIAQPRDEDEVLLHQEELAIMSEMIPARRKEFTAGRNAARRALKQLGVPAGALPRRMGDRDVVWPAGVTGSIAHGAGLVAVAVARTGGTGDPLAGLGLDIEGPDRVEDSVLQEVARADELAELAGQAEPACGWGKLLFVIKEAAYKAWYPGVRRVLEFHEMRVVLRDEHFEASVGPVVLPGKWMASPGHVAAGATLPRPTDQAPAG